MRVDGLMKIWRDEGRRGRGEALRHVAEQEGWGEQIVGVRERCGGNWKCEGGVKGEGRVERQGMR